MSHRPSRPSAVICCAFAAAIFTVASTAPATSGTTAHPTIIALDFADIESTDALKQRLEVEFAAALEPTGLEFPKLTFQAPFADREIDGAVLRARQLISRQRIWENETVIRACGPAGTLCFVITCTRCRGGER